MGAQAPNRPQIQHLCDALWCMWWLCLNVHFTGNKVFWAFCMLNIYPKLQSLFLKMYLQYKHVFACVLQGLFLIYLRRIWLRFLWTADTSVWKLDASDWRTHCFFVLWSVSDKLGRKSIGRTCFLLSHLGDQGPVIKKSYLQKTSLHHIWTFSPKRLIRLQSR